MDQNSSPTSYPMPPCFYRRQVGRSQSYKHLVISPSIFTSFLKAQMIYILSQRPFHCFSPSPLTNEWNAPSPRRAGQNLGAQKLGRDSEKAYSFMIHQWRSRKAAGSISTQSFWGERSKQLGTNGKITCRRLKVQPVFKTWLQSSNALMFLGSSHLQIHIIHKNNPLVYPKVKLNFKKSTGKLCQIEQLSSWVISISPQGLLTIPPGIQKTEMQLKALVKTDSENDRIFHALPWCLLHTSGSVHKWTCYLAIYHACRAEPATWITHLSRNSLSVTRQGNIYRSNSCG